MNGLPSGWTTAYVDDIKADAPNALAIGPFGSNLKVSDYRASGVPLVFVRNIRAKAFANGDLKFVSDAKAESLRAHRVRKGDLLVTKMGDPPGDAAIYPLDQEGIITADCIKLSAHLAINVRYLMYAVSSPMVKGQIVQITRGVAQRKVSLARFRRGVQIPLAPAAEQERIVAAIDEAFARIDAGVTGLALVSRRLKSMRAAVLEVAVREDKWMVGRPELLADDSSRLPEWRTVNVGDVAEVSGGITKNPKRAPMSNPIPFLRVANVQRNGLDLSEVHHVEVFDGELDRFRLKPNDLLVVEGNGSPDQIGRSALWDGSIDPCVHQNHLIRVRVGNEILPEYLNIFWNSPSGQRLVQAVASSTSGLHTLSTGKVRAIRLPLPPISTQHEIVATVAGQLSWTDRMENAMGPVIRRAQVLRSSILAAAFTGQLVPPDSSDEPASVLLERIASERAASEGRRSTTRTRKARTGPQKVTA